ncbi:hypothetical protein [Pseudomonas tussilaginis]|uniref:hypothetical protein n=1 Tax=Pseudomonas putida TaxID=303 RepID=UPI0023634332|nr:hypothetical protein [Pseudomonas putida]MDD1979001.1 hypothetical protein [Pseudomonas putida]
MSKPTIVTFTGAWRGYSAGEVAGFEEDVAQKLIDSGKAEPYTGKKGKKPSPAPASSSGKPVAAPASGPTADDGGPDGGPDEDGGTGNDEEKP